MRAKKTITFPVTLEKALLLWLPKVKAPDRFKCYREFMRFCLKWEKEWFTERGYRHKEESLEAVLARHKAEPFDQHTFTATGNSLLRWREQEISRKRSEAGKMGGRPKGG